MAATHFSSRNLQYSLALLLARDAQHLGVADVVMVTKQNDSIRVENGCESL